MAIVPKRESGEAGLIEPGIYAFEIRWCEEKTSQNGDAYFAAKLVASDFGGRLLCFDNIMLAGPGSGIGSAKLFALGYKEGQSVEAAELVGKRGFAAVKVKVYQGVKQLQVDIGAAGSECCGYWPEGEKPAGTKTPGEDDYGF